MSLDIDLLMPMPDWEPPGRALVFNANITHNLNRMAEAAGIYNHLWHPEKVGATHAHQLIAPLREAVAELEADPAGFEKYNAPNGWGLYKNFVPFVRQVLAACEEYPDAEIEVSR